jgi:hypothetical protein
MAQATVTPELGFALILTEQANSTLAMSADILGRFAKNSEACAQTKALLLELGQRLAQHHGELLKIATGGIVIVKDLPRTS